MSFPEMQITDCMRDAAKNMVYYAYKKDHEAHTLTPTGMTASYDSMQTLIQAAFDANPQYSAFASKPSDLPGYDLEYIRLDDAQKKEARGPFNAALAALVVEVTDTLKADQKIPASFQFKNDGEYYGSGKPPRHIPAELVERGRADRKTWAEAVCKRTGRALGPTE